MRKKAAVYNYSTAWNICPTAWDKRPKPWEHAFEAANRHESKRQTQVQVQVQAKCRFLKESKSVTSCQSDS